MKRIAVRAGRLLLLLVVCLLLLWGLYCMWNPGRDLRDGRHDRGRNAIWLQHGWLGHDSWFNRHNKVELRVRFRSPYAPRRLAAQLKAYHVTDVFPHLCPAQEGGAIPPVDRGQTEHFLDAMEGVRVLPWIGGCLGRHVFADDPEWRKKFVTSAVALLAAHPRLAGLHLNVEPCPSGNDGFLLLLDELRGALPEVALLSVAAYPPPTVFHRYSAVHWDEPYFREVARRCSQMAVMMYDTALTREKLYQSNRSYGRQASGPSTIASKGLEAPLVERVMLGVAWGGANGVWEFLARLLLPRWLTRKMDNAEAEIRGYEFRRSYQRERLERRAESHVVDRCATVLYLPLVFLAIAGSELQAARKAAKLAGEDLVAATVFSWIWRGVLLLVTLPTPRALSAR